ncbi:MAG: hypothetical protein QGG42_07540 [Phycisphaerae bacterium]|jgi:hypothetical protein|nr:hypothetical protein [Phycisphaerae bacterium]
MNNSTRLATRLIRPAVACVLTGIVAAWALSAGGAQPKDRYAAARKVYRGDTRMKQIPQSLATKPQPRTVDTIVPNTKHWPLPPAVPGHEAPVAKTRKLRTIHVRSTILAERPMETYRTGEYPDLQPAEPLAWVPFPEPSELSTPAVLSGPDEARAKLSNDPTAVQSRLAVLAGHAILRQTPARFLRLNIPDPFGVIDAIRLDVKSMPPDNDPIATPKTPPDPTMPITPRR